MSDSETIDVYNQQIDEYLALAEDLQEEYALDSFARRVIPNGHILDLGCGPGAASAVLQDQGFSVDAVDASAEMVRVAKSQYKVEARCGEFSDINEESVYDGIWANFSLLHATSDELPEILSSLHRALKLNGYFHIGMKVGEGSVSYTHLRAHESPRD